MGSLLSPFVGGFAFALALALAVAFVILVARFVGVCIPMNLSLTFMVLPAFVTFAATRIERPLLALVAEVGGCFLLLGGRRLRLAASSSPAPSSLPASVRLRLGHLVLLDDLTEKSLCSINLWLPGFPQAWSCRTPSPRRLFWLLPLPG